MTQISAEDANPILSPEINVICRLFFPLMTQMTAEKKP
jgi:hypothetical protein